MRIFLRRSLNALLVPFFLCTLARAAEGQESTEGFRDPFPASRWCEDSATACWSGADERDWLNGIRIIADFDVRFLFQRGGNRFVHSGFLSLSKLAFEVNLYKSWVAFQVAIRGPGDIQFDSLSAIRGVLRNPERVIPTDMGLSAGLSFLDSSVALLYGWMDYDRRHFKASDCAAGPAEEAEKRRRAAGSQAQCVLPTDKRDSYVYLTFQPLSAIRSGIKQGREEDDDTPESAPSSTAAIPFHWTATRP